jgi:glutamine---fructose-6-phosphate transaminase (isomerizing)
MSPTAILLRAEMAEQPRVLRDVFARRDEITDSVRASGLVPRLGTLLVARGSSDHAAIYARYLIELVTGLPVSIAPPSLYTRYGSRPSLEGWVAVALSQSGETPEIVQTLRALVDCGARAVAVTNNVGSALAREAELVVDLHCGAERAVPATKTFTASIAAVGVLAAAWGTVPWTADDERRATAAVEAVLGSESAVEPAAHAIRDADVVTYLGRGFSYASALEGALKLREMTGRPAEGFAAADYLHGPVASADRRTQVVACASPGPTLADVLAGAKGVAARGAQVLIVAPDDVPVDEQPTLRVAAGLAEPLTVIPMTVRLQQLALAAALQDGVDPDQPFGLAKVTLTR